MVSNAPSPGPKLLNAMPLNAMPLNAMTVDVEDYFHAEALVSVRGGDTVLPRFEASTLRLLELFASRGVKATFFTLGWVAQQAPGLIRRIVEEGHELAAHGYSHTRITEQTPDEFRSDIRRTKSVLEQAGGVLVRGYRAPTFSVNATNQWVYSILVEEGFCWSSSVYPVHHDLYGMPGTSRVPYFPVEDLDFPEIPMSTVKVGGKILQGGGGGYFRLLPYGISSWAIRRVNAEDNQPFMFYCHPWEIDAGQPRVSGLPLKSRVRHYTNLSRMEAKLDRLTQEFSWGRVDEVFEVARVNSGSEMKRHALDRPAENSAV